MYAWRCFLAVVFVLVWYFSEFGQIWTQAFFCFLCFLNFPFKKQDRETSTQTDATHDETEQQKKEAHRVGVVDETDATRAVSVTKEYTNVHRSLLQVFKCAYVHLVQPWYTVPELGDSQPLHRALLEEFNLVVEKVICKAKNFDLSVTSVGCIRIFTQHLHNAKQSDGSPAFSSRSEEMAVLRTFSQALVRNLFPEYLWEAKLYQCVLTEIVATKALDVLVTSLCNPDNLNQMVVLQLGRVTSKSSTENLLHSDREGTPSSMGSEEAEVLTDEAEDSRSEDTKEKKKAGSRIKERFSKFVDKVKSKKAKKKQHKKKKEQELLQKALASRRSAVIEDDDASSREGSMRSAFDSDCDSESDVYLTTCVQEDMMEFRLSYEMWRVGKWAVRVTNKENEELSFTVHLEERNNPENLNWDDTSTLPSVSAIVEKTKKDLDDAGAEEVRSALEHFLQELVSDAQLCHTQPVFQFLCPIAQLLSDKEHEGGVWSFLNGLASFLTPGQDEDGSHNLRGDDKLDESGVSLHHSGPIIQPACIDMDEEPKGGAVEVPMATNARFTIGKPREETDTFRRKEPDMEVQNSDEQDVISDGQESLAESLDIFVNRSKLVSPSGHSNDISSSAVNHTEGIQSDSVEGCRNTQSVGKTNKKEKLAQKKSNGSQQLKVKEKTGQLKEEMTNQPQAQKKEPQNNWEQVEATKAVFELLKEITGNSVLVNIVDAILKPVQPLLKKKINNFLKRMHPTEAQIASYIDNFREKIWPDGNAPIQPPSDSEDKHETKDKALQLISSKYSNLLILKKTEVETIFKIFQDTEENKKLVYMLLSYILGQFLPGEPAFSAIPNLTVKDFVS
ncbi:Sorting nexin-25 [Labeo rohita]|uniref:Sorting nexin-25 n=1 Tax=Labeo rohita TaxID=84645 RepID=A0ABQ8M1Q4_LABRO|nr:Sorting nexin-25 [Labeo rohita]